MYHANVATKPPSKRSERHVAISPQPTKRPTELRTVSPRIEINGDPDVIDVIHMLRHPSYEVEFTKFSTSKLVATISQPEYVP